ncbi:MAG: aminopeptidase P family protein [Caulobacteraceae bacterium]|nr:aminopeptidase P family protein [Caulobacteraceae bacterium]
MFDPQVYADRRARLRGRLDRGLVLLPGARPSPMNFAANAYPFVQDSSFSYLFGLIEPDLVGLVDLDSGQDVLFGDDIGLDAVIWHGPTSTLAERAARARIDKTRTLADLAPALDAARRQGRPVHYLPPYRGEAVLQLAELLDRPPAAVRAGASEALARAVLALREIKGPEEIAEMERACAVAGEMHRAAMAVARPGVFEREVVGEMEAVARRLDWQCAYASIFSKRGEVLHNPHHHLRLEAGDLVVNDSGVSSGLGYASDITRTLPIGGRFTQRQRPVYEAVLSAQRAAIAAIAPGVRYLDVHRLAARVLVEHLAGLGLFRGDPAEVVETGAYAIAFQCGLGHQIGLDVHDMESFGEDLVGYDGQVGRSPLFGLSSLRLAKPLAAGMTVTVEPGVYFIPQQIERWAAEGRFARLIDYDRFRACADFGGVRIEDDVLVTATGARILGPPIPKSVEEVEAAMG